MCNQPLGSYSFILSLRSIGSSFDSRSRLLRVSSTLANLGNDDGFILVRGFLEKPKAKL